jgi:hypothetical protein
MGENMQLNSKPKSISIKVQEHRKRLRAQGLQPIQIWVPDICAVSFREQAHKQSAAVTASTTAPEDQTFVDIISTALDIDV